MKLIDFDHYFRAYVENWIAQNADGAVNYEQLEARIGEVRLKFLNAPAPWLDGETPGVYFQKFDDAAALVRLIERYEAEGVPTPDLLLERVADLKERSVPALTARAADEALPEHVRVTMLNLLNEIGSDAPLALCLRIVRERAEDDALADVAAELLKNIGRAAEEAILSELSDASDDALLTFLDILCNFPGDERIYTYTARQFANRPDQRMYYASYLARLGEPRALDLLYAALSERDLNYLDYIEIRNAIEALGGDAPEEPEFSGDPYYESLRRIE